MQNCLWLMSLISTHLIMCIFQVVLPLPGYNVEYPKNEIKEWYTELLEADGLNLNSLKHEVK